MKVEGFGWYVIRLTRTANRIMHIDMKYSMFSNVFVQIRVINANFTLTSSEMYFSSANSLAAYDTCLIPPWFNSHSLSAPMVVHVHVKYLNEHYNSHGAHIYSHLICKYTAYTVIIIHREHFGI